MLARGLCRDRVGPGVGAGRALGWPGVGLGRTRRRTRVVRRRRCRCRASATSAGAQLRRTRCRTTSTVSLPRVCNECRRAVATNPMSSDVDGVVAARVQRMHRRIWSAGPYPPDQPTGTVPPSPPRARLPAPCDARTPHRATEPAPSDDARTGRPNPHRVTTPAPCEPPPHHGSGTEAVPPQRRTPPTWHGRGRSAMWVRVSAADRHAPASGPCPSGSKLPGSA